MLLWPPAGVAAETYGHDFLETLGYIDVAVATVGLVAIVLGYFARVGAEAAKQRA